ncbi:MAG: hypothetical protein VX505_01580 [Chloroflexota bacterium]|jgi:hypothetical protein|nr:hypothetical protein [Chloroflexota bacterium]
MPAITAHNSRLSSVFSSKKPTAHSSDLPRDAARAWGTTSPEQYPGTDKVYLLGAPINVDFDGFSLFNHHLLVR